MAHDFDPRRTCIDSIDGERKKRKPLSHSPLTPTQQGLPKGEVAEFQDDNPMPADQAKNMPVLERLARKADELEKKLQKKEKISRDDPTVKRIIEIRSALESSDVVRIGKLLSKLWPDDFGVTAFNELSAKVRAEAKNIQEEKQLVRQLTERCKTDKTCKEDLERAQRRLLAAENKRTKLFNRVRYFSYNSALAGAIYDLQALF